MNLKRYSKKQFRTGSLIALLTLWLLSFQVLAKAAEITVSGRVTDGSDGSALPGVNVSVKDTQSGTITDSNGQFTIQVNENATLVFSFIGYAVQEVPVNGRTSFDVSLQPSTETLGEVVVTALGIERDEQSLGYAVGKLKGDEITNVAQENVLNSMAARVPGVTINSTGGAGSSVRMTIRGTTSLTNDNQPLFVIDGVPVVNSLNNVGQVGSDNRVDYGNPIADLNPDNIASISILKGPSAAALYGSRAGNGVVLVTTKNGSHVKKLTVSVTSNTVIDVPYKFLDMHHKFASGYLPYTPDKNPHPGGVLTIDESSVGGVGPELDKGYNAIQWNSPEDEFGNKIAIPLVSHRNNIRNFVRNGITSSNDVAVSNSTDLITYRIAYSNMSNKGIIPNTDLFRNSLSLNSSVKVSPKFRLSNNIDVSRSNSNNRPAGNRGANPLQWAYAVSPHIDIRDLRDYWEEGQEGLQQRTQDNGAGEYNNPYFLAYEINNGYVRDRLFGNLKADWQLTNSLSLMGRYALDTYQEQRETKMANSYTEQPNGGYGLMNIKQYERNADLLLTYDKTFEPFTLSASVGGNNRYYRNSYVTTQTKNGTGLITPGVYSINNIATDNLQYESRIFEKAVYSAYGLINVGYKDMVFLDLTARNDWSSTLPTASRSYFYPSASLSLLVNKAVKLPDMIDLLKLRGGVAQAGNDTDPYQLYNVMDAVEAWGGTPRLSKSGTLLVPDLKSEKATSWEGGIDFGLFNGKVRFAGTYYYLENRNQILSNDITPSSGYTNLSFNAGLVVSKGVELSLGGTPIDKNGFRLDATVNYSKNESIIKSLSDGQNRFTFWTDARGGAWTYVGDRIGDIYDAELVTVKDPNSPYYGYPLLDEEGSWQDVRAANTKTRLGNYNPDFIVGLQTSLTYRRFSLNLSFDWRSGGVFVSQTYRYSESDLKTQRFLDNLIHPGGRDGDALRDWLVANDDEFVKVRGNRFNIVGGPTAEYGGFPFDGGDGNIYPYGVFNPGVIAEYDDDGNIIGYIENLGGPGTKILPYGANYPWSFTRAATFDASFVKLREISLGYALPTSLVSRFGLQSANIAVYSRNIMLWTAAKIGIDPETAFQQEASTQGGGMQFKQGIERYNVTPWVLPVGFKLNLTF